jgi:hypothetical protein
VLFVVHVILRRGPPPDRGLPVLDDGSKLHPSSCRSVVVKAAEIASIYTEFATTAFYRGRKRLR